MKTRHQIKLGDATDLHFIPDSSVDLIVTSPPYFGQREYLDDEGNVIHEAVGSEATPDEYLKALDRFMDEAWRVLKPSGSVFVNLGDKYAGSGGHNNASIQGKEYDATKTTRDAPARYVQVEGIRRKSLMGLPLRFAINQIDRGWVMRMDMIWDKPNGMPESVTDRVRKTHEYWFHFTKEEKYYAAVDELREPHEASTIARAKTGRSDEAKERNKKAKPPAMPPQKLNTDALSPLGKLPASVQRISTGGVRPTAKERVAFNLPEHFAPFPAEWPRFLILGWSPKAWCGECGEPVHPAMERTFDGEYNKTEAQVQQKRNQATRGVDRVTLGRTNDIHRTITHYGCGCDVLNESAWLPSIVLDPFGGTGTTSLVAKILDRSSISVDISPAYVRLMKWRVMVSAHRDKLIAKWKKKGLL